MNSIISFRTNLYTDNAFYAMSQVLGSWSQFSYYANQTVMRDVNDEIVVCDISGCPYYKSLKSIGESLELFLNSYDKKFHKKKNACNSSYKDKFKFTKNINFLWMKMVIASDQLHMPSDREISTLSSCRYWFETADIDDEWKIPFNEALFIAKFLQGTKNIEKYIPDGKDWKGYHYVSPFITEARRSTLNEVCKVNEMIQQEKSQSEWNDGIAMLKEINEISCNIGMTFNNLITKKQKLIDMWLGKFR